MADVEASQTANHVEVEFDVAVPMRDGTILRANVYRPAQPGRWPVILMRLPYGKDLPPSVPAVDPAQAARKGYVAIVQDTRGRYASDGDWSMYERDGLDGFDTVEWAAHLPYANGAVGMYGQSYMGWTQLRAAMESPPALRAIVPTKTWLDPLNGFYYRGGALEIGMLGTWLLAVMGPDILARRHASDPATMNAAIAALVDDVDALAASGYKHLPASELPHFARHDLDQGFADIADRPMDAAAVEHFSLVGQVDRIRTPALHVGGWYDMFVQDTIRLWQGMRDNGVPSSLVIGPWHHLSHGSTVGEVDFGTRAYGDWLDLGGDFTTLHLRWFDRWLRGIRNGVDEEPPVRIFVMGTNRWRQEASWPLERAVETPYFLQPAGGLSPVPAPENEPDHYDYDPHDPVPVRGGAALGSPEYPPGAYDQALVEARADVLTFSSPPLETDTEVTGDLVVHLWASSSAPDTDFIARLCDVFPDGRSFGLTDGILRARYRERAKGEHSASLEPGRPYEFVIDLWVTSNVFRAGHRIRVDITSSCFPRWDRNTNTGDQSDTSLRVAHQAIHHDPRHPSRIILPIVPT